MPIYEYRCSSCQAELEKLQKISDPPLIECPECGKDTLVKLISASSFRLKGSGWYETDFKTGNRKNGAGEESVGRSDPASADSSADAGTKPAAKDAVKAAPDSAGKKEGTASSAKVESNNNAAPSSKTPAVQPKSG